MKKSPVQKIEKLKLLGRSDIAFPSAPTASTLDTFKNKFSQRNYRIRFESTEFTSMCPVTGQPDFAQVTIDYIPDALCIETKSLKFYLASFRNTRSFNEEIVNRILEDLIEACTPRWVNVHGEFSARGGISVTVDATYPDTEIEAAKNGKNEVRCSS